MIISIVYIYIYIYIYIYMAIDKKPNNSPLVRDLRGRPTRARWYRVQVEEFVATRAQIARARMVWHNVLSLYCLWLGVTMKQNPVSPRTL